MAAGSSGSDVVVIGGGVIGAATAMTLAEAGRSVTVVDPAGVGGETSSRCEGNILVSDKSADPQVRPEAELAIYSNALWGDLADLLRGDPSPGAPETEFERKGGVVVAFGVAADALRTFADGQRGLGIRAEEVDRDAVRALEPHLSPAVESGVWYPDDAQVQPALATLAMWARARRFGARLVRAEVSGGIVSGGRLAGVVTDGGTIRADAVVNCAGPWSGEVARRLGVALDIRPRRGCILVSSPMPQRVFHKVYDADYVGAVGSGDAQLQTSTVVESTPAGTVLVGSSRERVGFSTTGELPAVAEIAAKACSLFPFLSDAQVLRSYMGFRPYAPDHLPVIGPDARLPGLLHAAGHEGAGIGLAPATARLIAHHLLGRETPLDPTPFLPSRASLTQTEAL